MTYKQDQGAEKATLAGIADRNIKAAVIGLGYVGLPLCAAIARAGFSVIGIDVDTQKVNALNGGTSYIDAVKRHQ
jgi:UDP-N-acetyl-D-glucosamine dehydrogenase